MTLTTRRIPSVLLLAAALSVVSGPAAAQPAPASGAGEQTRLFDQFFTDAAIARQWWEIQFRWMSGAVPPVQEADGFGIGPVIALSPIRNFEFGGQVFFTDVSLDRPITFRGERFDGDSGAGDLDLFAKYRIMDGDFKLALGGSLTIPTGSENDGLGTGELVPAVFAAMRTRLSHSRADLTAVAHVGFRFNSDAEILGRSLDAQMSAFLGGGIIVEWRPELSWSAEVSFESERFEDTDSSLRLTGGLSWAISPPRHTLRGAVSLGLADAAPDFQLTGGYVYKF